MRLIKEDCSSLSLLRRVRALEKLFKEALKKQHKSLLRWKLRTFGYFTFKHTGIQYQETCCDNNAIIITA